MLTVWLNLKVYCIRDPTLMQSLIGSSVCGRVGELWQGRRTVAEEGGWEEKALRSTFLYGLRAYLRSELADRENAKPHL